MTVSTGSGAGDSHKFVIAPDSRTPCPSNATAEGDEIRLTMQRFIGQKAGLAISAVLHLLLNQLLDFLGDLPLLGGVQAVEPILCEAKPPSKKSHGRCAGVSLA